VLLYPEVEAGRAVRHSGRSDLTRGPLRIILSSQGKSILEQAWGRVANLRPGGRGAAVGIHVRILCGVGKGNLADARGKLMAGAHVGEAGGGGACLASGDSAC
jgi:hypothetical protein